MLILILIKGPGKRGHIVADTLLPMMFLELRKLGNICCGHKMFLNKIKHFLCPGHKFCVRNKCCARGQTGKHLCRQQCVRNNVSSFARALSWRVWRVHLSYGVCRLRARVQLKTLSSLLNVNYACFNGFLRNVLYSFQNLLKALVTFSLKRNSQKTFLFRNLL